MASVHSKNRKHGLQWYTVYKDQQKKQRWIPCENKKKAIDLRDEIDEETAAGRMFIYPPDSETLDYAPDTPMTVSELLDKYADSKCARSWEAGTDEYNRSLIENYIKPAIGELRVADVKPATIQDFYDDLLSKKAKGKWRHKGEPKNLTARHVVDINKILNPAFSMAVIREIIAVNPVTPVDLPEPITCRRAQWTANELEKAFSICDDIEEKVFIALMSNCTLRSGELSGLDWACVDISAEAIDADEAYITINKSVRRINKLSLNKTQSRNILFVFPNFKSSAKSVLVVKKPKTKQSVRDITLTKELAGMLVEYKAIQDQKITDAGKMFVDYGYRFVISQMNGRPYTPKSLSNRFKRFIDENGLRPVDAYSLRHTGISVKLRETKDIISTQADGGHATPIMILKRYAEIEEEDRKKTARAVSNLLFRKPDSEKEYTKQHEKTPESA